MSQKVLLWITAAFFMTPIVSSADRSFGNGWAGLELLLKEQGVETDTPSLIEEIRSGRNPTNRWAAIEILGLRKEQSAQSILLETLENHEDRLIRETAALALARLGHQTGEAALRTYMHSSEEWSRQLFLAARLAELGDPSGYQYVAAASSDEDSEIRFLSIGILVAYIPFDGTSEELKIEATEEFLDKGRDGEIKVRREFLVQVPVAIVKGIEMTRLRPLIEDLAENDPDPQIRDTARLQLEYWTFEQEGREREEGGLR